jgi:predicted nucleic acid-binding protein
VADVFFDTNVLLYILSTESGKADRAEALLAGGGALSVQVLNEFASVAARKLNMETAEIREILATVRAVCTVVPMTVEIHDLALDLVEQHRFSIYDALIVAAAQRAGCDVLYTEDLHHGQMIGRLSIRNPFVT